LRAPRRPQPAQGRDAADPHGAQRRAAKDDLEIEVKSEHVEQIALATAVTRPTNPAFAVERRCDGAVANIAAYFRRHGFTPDAEDARQVAIVLDPAFPQIGRAALAEKFHAEATA
jgi:hypothetical protein